METEYTVVSCIISNGELAELHRYPLDEIGDMGLDELELNLDEGSGED